MGLGLINWEATEGTCGIARRNSWQPLSAGGGEGGGLQKRIAGAVWLSESETVIFSAQDKYRLDNHQQS